MIEEEWRGGGARTTATGPLEGPASGCTVLLLLLLPPLEERGPLVRSFRSASLLPYLLVGVADLLSSRWSSLSLLSFLFSSSSLPPTPTRKPRDVRQVLDHGDA
jgi:hypothetical protein